MDKETARRLLQTGATFVLENLPTGSEFGIDMNVYTVGEKFKGVKMIPAGVHFIYFSSVSDYDNRSLSPRSGFFKLFKEKEVYVKWWDRNSEDMDVREASQEEADRYRENLPGSLDQFLGPYDYSTYEKWSGLTDYISLEVINRLNPQSCRIDSVPALMPEPFVSSKSCRSSCKRQEEIELPSASSSLTSDQLDKLLPDMKTEASSMIKFTEIGKIRHPEGCSAADITKHSLDSSHMLDSIIKQYRANTDSLLGEVQFAFVCFLIGHVYESFTHWKDMTRLICTANRALEKYDSFFLNYIRVLHFQVQEVPPDLFVDIINSNNFLLLTLRELFFHLEHNAAVSAVLKRRGIRFRAHLEAKFGWRFSVENSDDDEAPVVLHLGD